MSNLSYHCWSKWILLMKQYGNWESNIYLNLPLCNSNFLRDWLTWRLKPLSISLVMLELNYTPPPTYYLPFPTQQSMWAKDLHTFMTLNYISTLHSLVQHVAERIRLSLNVMFVYLHCSAVVLLLVLSLRRCVNGVVAVDRRNSYMFVIMAVIYIVSMFSCMCM